MVRTTDALPPSSYETFAPFYDAFTADSDYEAWTSHALELARRHGMEGARLLDVACGTGKSFEPFLQRGFEVTATDVSPAMLAEAARKSPTVRLVEADMRRLPTLGRFDLVTCFDDSLNHLLAEEELAAALGCIANNLNPSGLLLFDLNTLLAYRTTFAVDAISESCGSAFLLHGESSPEAPPGCVAAVRIDAFRELEHGRYERLSTRVVQRHFPPHRVTALMARAGLECLGVHGVLDDGSHVPDADETRQLKLMYVARLDDSVIPPGARARVGGADVPGHVGPLTGPAVTGPIPSTPERPARLVS
jgi:SAM-dependent methyltransferase